MKLTWKLAVPLRPLIKSTISAVPNGDTYHRLVRVARIAPIAVIGIAASAMFPGSPLTTRPARSTPAKVARRRWMAGARLRSGAGGA